MLIIKLNKIYSIVIIIEWMYCIKTICIDKNI